MQNVGVKNTVHIFYLISQIFRKTRPNDRIPEKLLITYWKPKIRSKDDQNF